MEEEYVGGRKSKLTWGADLSSQLVPKQVKAKFSPIPVDEGIYGRNKTGYVISHSSQLENPLYLNDYVKTKYHEGWTWRNDQDLDGDNKNDTVVYNAEGKPMVWNGYHYVRNAPMLDREVFMQNPDNEAKYGYSIKKYKWDIKSPFEKMLHNIAKNYYNQIKSGIEDGPQKKIVLSDLSTNFIKSFIKQAILIPYLIDVGLIQNISIQGYINALAEVAQNKDVNPEYKYGKAADLMALFKLASKVLDTLTPDQANRAQRIILQMNAGDIYKNYKKYHPFSSKGGNKLRFIIDCAVAFSNSK